MAQKNNNKEVKAAAKEQQTSMEETLNRWEEFFEKYKTAVIAAVVAVIVIVAGIGLYRTKVVAPRETRVAEYLFPGERYMLNEQYDVALNGDESGFSGFKDIADNYGGTKSGKLAAAYAGLCYAHLDSFDIAIKYLSKFKGKDLMVAPAVEAAKGDCYASVDKLSEAASAFEKAAKMADNEVQTPMYLFKAGLIYEAMNQSSQALKAYNRIKNEYPSSSEAAKIESYITRLTAK